MMAFVSEAYELEGSATSSGGIEYGVLAANLMVIVDCWTIVIISLNPDYD
jgi:hypothetical protein